MQNRDYSKSRNDYTQTSNNSDNQYQVANASAMTIEELIEAIREKIREV